MRFGLVFGEQGALPAMLLPIRLHDAYNFTAPGQVSQGEFSKTAARLARRPCFLPAPGWPVRLLLGEQAVLLLEGQTVAPQRLLASGFAFRHPTVASALAGLI